MEKQCTIVCPVCRTRHLPTAKPAKDKAVYAATCENCNHLFKFREVVPYKTDITLTVNGQKYTVGNDFRSSASLNDFLREKRVSMGTKVFCRQGGCGICIVVAKMRLNPNTAPVTANLNSCLCPLFLCDGWEITTVEGLGSTKTQMNQIQSTLADYGGTQCGYCSSGHVMNMYGIMQLYPSLTKRQVEDLFEGNLCRCTGYRPILDAMKSLVSSNNPDIEDLTKGLCKTSGRPCSSNSGSCGGRCGTEPSPIRMVFGDLQWLKATDYTDLLHLLAQHQGQKVRLLGANTGTGYFFQESVDNFDVVIDITGVPELFVNTHDASTGVFTLGANVTLTEMLDLFTTQAAKSGDNGNFNELKKYLYRVASSPIRNRGTWAGNLMLKNKYPTFPSDIFNIMAVLKASLTIGPTPQDVVSVDGFFKTKMDGKCLSKVTFNGFSSNDVVVSFKVMPRSQDVLALVNGAFRCNVNKSNGYLVTGQPIISIGGINGTFHRATATESYLIGKHLSDPLTLSGALTSLASEVVPDSAVTLPSASYRKTVACALLYKFFLHVLGDTAGVRFRSAFSVLHDVRPISSGTQTYDTNKQEWPVNKPLTKLEANVQCTGEAIFTDDLPPLPGQLYGAFVTSTQANATITTIDASPALKLAGVVKVLTSFDIPPAGVNDVTAPMSLSNQLEPEEVFCSGQVSYYGQSLALVVAESQEIAEKAARLVTVTYTNIQSPVLTIDQAIAAKQFFKKPVPEMVVGNPDQVIAAAPHVTTGTTYLSGQHHWCMETQATNVTPTEDGLDIVSTTQWTDSIQQAVSLVTGIQKNRINVSVKRLGGAYGSKITRNNIVAGAAGLAAKLTNRPVRMLVKMRTSLEMLGGRFPYKADYTVGHDDHGKLLGINVNIHGNMGYLPNDDDLFQVPQYIDNAYFCPNWRINCESVRTNTPQNTACRAPGSTPAILMMETMIEHVARTLNQDPIVVKQNNLYQQGQVTPIGMTLQHCNMEAVMTELMSSAQVKLRQQMFDYYNRDNRWKKKALAVVPIKFGIDDQYVQFSVLVSVLAPDGTVSVHHGGVENGQGINTKVAQVVAYELGIPVTMVCIKSPNSIIDANNATTGYSHTSEACCKGAIYCCQQILSRMAPVKAKMVNPTWAELVDRCFLSNVVLSERKTVAGVFSSNPADAFVYNSYGATCAEVEVDVLTGEYQVNRVDIVFDCGESLNPAVDIGQVEGAFIMGLGYSTCEEVKYDPTSGKILAYDTWTYHPPTNKDIPVDFRISLLKNVPNPLGVLRSKASGEPPLCMSCSVLFALRKCIEEARKEVGQTGYFTLDVPATVEKVQKLCLVDPSQFVLQ